MIVRIPITAIDKMVRATYRGELVRFPICSIPRDSVITGVFVRDDSIHVRYDYTNANVEPVEFLSIRRARILPNEQELIE